PRAGAPRSGIARPRPARSARSRRRARRRLRGSFGSPRTPVPSHPEGGGGPLTGARAYVVIGGALPGARALRGLLPGARELMLIDARLTGACPLGARPGGLSHREAPSRVVK